MRKLLLTGLMAAGLVFSGTAFAVDTEKTMDSEISQGTSQLSNSDLQFMKKAAQGGMLEVKLGNLATEQAASEDVKKFGEEMVMDHSKVNKELMQLASEKGVTLPKELDAEHQEKVDQLSKLSGAEFDRTYMSEMVKDHKKDIEDFQNQSNRTGDPDLKEFTSKTLPTLRDHMQKARNIAEEVGADQQP
ncbi:MAG TPA: DUF4142 domain-containing protein [Thermodesulfobacteriota bacterium]|nr:DUF4142 domain-containing protein [Thermodesulfobacteriota bacterium]